MGLLEDFWTRAKNSGKTVVFPEGYDERTIDAANLLRKDNLANVILLGSHEKVKSLMSAKNYTFDCTIIDIEKSESLSKYAQAYYEKRKAKGMTQEEALKEIKHEVYFGAMMVETGDADLCITGAVNSTADVLKAAFKIIGSAPGIKTVSSSFIMDFGANSSYGHNGIMLFGDCAVNTFPDAQTLADIAIATANTARKLGIEPKVAMLSYSTKGSNTMEEAKKIAKATEIVNEREPNLLCDGELQVDAAISPAVAKLKAPGSKVAGIANCLIFPDINAGNIGYKLAQRFSNAKAIGPVMQGLKKPMNDLSRGSVAEEIAMLTAIQILNA